MAKRSRYEEEEPSSSFDEATFDAAMQAWTASNPATPADARADKYIATRDILRHITDFIGEGCTPKHVHDHLVARGYRYKHGPLGFTWLVGRS